MGRETKMTVAMEQKLCSGRNFEHTHGSVYSSKLELLFQLCSTWKLITAEFEKADNKKVL